MKVKRCIHLVLAFILVLLSILACGAPVPQEGETPVPTADSAELWLRLAGQEKADQSWAVVTDADENLYWGTFQQTPGELFTDMVIYKYDPLGNLLWETRWGGEYQEKLFIMAVSPPYLFAAGEQDHSIDVSQADMIVLALDLQDGHVVWEFTYDQGFGYEEVDGLVVDGGDIYLSGWTTSEITGNDVGVLKLDRQGSLLWTQVWGSSGWDQADGQMIVDDEFVYITGRYDGQNYLFGGYGLLARFHKDTGEPGGHTVWDESQFYDGYGMTSDGTYLYITGLTIVPKGLTGDGQIFVQKWDKDFNLLWECQWGGNQGDQARAIAVDDAGRIVVGGNAIVDGDHQIVLLVYDGNGNLLHEALWGAAGDDIVHGLWIDGEYAYLAGETRSLGAGQNDALLLKVHIPTASFPSLP